MIQYTSMWPAWVRMWVEDNNALASVDEFKVMPASYAMKYIPKCKRENATRSLRLRKWPGRPDQQR